jgi:hypothetical protein
VRLRDKEHKKKEFRMKRKMMMVLKVCLMAMK